MNILEQLNAAGDALKATGERSVVLTFFTMDDGSFRYAVRLDMPGTSGVHGSGLSPAEAYQAALNQRAADEARAELEAQIRAEVEERMAALGRQKAA